MSRWNELRWFKPAPKRPPPERGIRMKKAGTTWWGQRWIAALEEVLRGDAGRLARGRTYARAGRTHDLVVKGGKVSAKVTGSRATPYQIRIELQELTGPAWKKAIEAMALKAQFSVELLAGQMPQAIDEAFQAAGVSLFPTKRADLATSCSCPDWGDPCKHVAATHYVLGEALDRNPFLLFELRGRTKAQVLDELRAARGDASEPAPAPKKGTRKKGAVAAEAPAEIAAVKLGPVKAADYNRPREPLPSLHLGFEAPAAGAAVLRQLGAPPAWQSEEAPADLFAPLVRAAAETARRLAMADSSPPPAEPELSATLTKGAPKRRPRSARRGRRA